GNNYFLRIRVSGGRIWLSAQNGLNGPFNESNYVDLPTGVDNVEVRAAYSIRPPGTQDALYFRVGDVVQWPVNVPDLGEGDADRSGTDGLILVNHDVGFNDLWYSYINSGNIRIPERDDDMAWSGVAREARYAASLDKGLQDLTHLPIRDGDDAWDVIQDVVGAEFGSAFWDEKGIFRFWNAHRIRDLQSKVVRRLTLDDVSGLQITNSLDSVRNIWSLDATKKTAQYARIYESTDVDEFYVPGHARLKARIWVDNIAAPDPFDLQRYRIGNESNGGPWPEWNDNVDHGYVAQWYVNGAWRQMPSRARTSELTLAYYTDTGELILEFWNGFDEPMRFAGGPDNTPAL